jgi:hypothetical protein
LVLFICCYSQHHDADRVCSGKPILWANSTGLPFYSGEPNDANRDNNFEQGEPCLVMAVGNSRPFGMNDVSCFEGSTSSNRDTSW